MVVGKVFRLSLHITVRIKGITSFKVKTDTFVNTFSRHYFELLRIIYMGQFICLISIIIMTVFLCVPWLMSLNQVWSCCSVVVEI
jgi:hypothetical protein